MASTLPNPDNCCEAACEEQVSVAVPGPQGEPGEDGDDGIDGINAFTTITGGAEVMPVEGGLVTLSVVDSTWIAPSQIIFIEGRGYLKAQNKPNSTSVVLQNIEDTATGAYPTNSAPGTPFTALLRVSPGGLQGPVGDTGPSGDAELLSGEAYFIGHGNCDISLTAETVLFPDLVEFKIALPSAGRYLVTAQMYIENKEDGNAAYIFGHFYRGTTGTVVASSLRKVGMASLGVSQFTITSLVDVVSAQDLKVQTFRQTALSPEPVVKNEEETGPFQNPAYLCYVKVSDP